jgi:CubicO group peptidase (beta-lactamase class C family)
MIVTLWMASCTGQEPARSSNQTDVKAPSARANSVPPLIVQVRGDVLVPGTTIEAGLSDAAVQSAVALYRDEINAGRVAGGVLLIARHGRVVVHEAFGWRDVHAKARMDRTAMFRMSSNTKAVTAVGVALLADRGKLRFSDAVSIHIPSWDNRRARAITIHQLLSHTSGIRIDGLFAPEWFRWPWSAPRTLRTETDRIGRVGAAAAPGNSYFYTNAGYNALGGLVETVSGHPLEVFLHDDIFSSLGMWDSYSFEADEKLQAKSHRLGPTYVAGDRGVWTVTWRPGDPPEVPFPRGSGGLVTTAQWRHLWRCPAAASRDGARHAHRAHSGWHARLWIRLGD